jgi:hypothetical protein
MTRAARLRAQIAASTTMSRRDWLLWLPAIIGFAVLVVVWATLPSEFLGDDLAAYVGAGEAFRLGEPLYFGRVTEQGVFLYGPIWAILFAPLSLLPTLPVHLAIAALDLLCLRYLVRSWRAVGWLMLLPVVPFSITSGNIDLLIAASIVLAWRTTSGPLAVLASAKLAPALALPLARWREAAAITALMLVLTLPWAHLWVEWLAFLMDQPTRIGLMLPIPWWARLPVAALLCVPRRPWTSALAVAIAAPGFYWTTTVLFLAPLRLFLDRRDPVLVVATEQEWQRLGWLDSLLGAGTRRRVAALAGSHRFVLAAERRERGEALS